jgi:hypothetical protein
MKPKNLLQTAAFVMAVFLTACNDDSETVMSPSVSQTDIINNATGVPRNKAIEVTFSEDMDATTINTNTFIVRKGSNPVEGNVSYSDRKASFQPAQLLDPNETYNVRITMEVKDMQGNSLRDEKIWSFTTAGTKDELKPVLLRDAADFAILAKTAIINNPNSAIDGDMGISPGVTSYIAGFSLIDRSAYASSTQVNGKVFAPDMNTSTAINLMSAVNSMAYAYDDAAKRSSPDFLDMKAGAIGGATLTPGVYKWTNSVNASGDVVLTGGEYDVWIFQVAGDLKVSPETTFILQGGAQSENIFWQVVGEVNVGENAHLEGNLLSKSGIVFHAGASLDGRALSETAVVLHGNKIVKP